MNNVRSTPTYWKPFCLLITKKLWVFKCLIRPLLLYICNLYLPTVNRILSYLYCTVVYLLIYPVPQCRFINCQFSLLCLSFSSVLLKLSDVADRQFYFNVPGTGKRNKPIQLSKGDCEPGNKSSQCFRLKKMAKSFNGMQHLQFPKLINYHTTFSFQSFFGG